MKYNYDSIPLTRNEVDDKYHRKFFKPYVRLFIVFLIISLLTFTIVFTIDSNIFDSSSTSKDEDEDEVLVVMKPNFLFIMIDDFMWRVLYERDSDLVEYCPNMISLMSVGVNISHYYSQQMCIPARAALFTGKYPIHIGYQKQNLYIFTYGS